MSKNVLRMLIAMVFVISTIVFIVKQDWLFATIFGVVVIVFVLRWTKEMNQHDRNDMH